MTSPELAGYLHPGYAASLAEFGTPRLLPRSGGWVLERKIPDTSSRDAMGCYPLFACQDWKRLHEDLKEMEDDIVSLTLVTDPFGDYTVDVLRDCFPDRLNAFKEHFVIDLKAGQTISKHHRYYAQRAQATIQVELVTDFKLFLDDWLTVYEQLSSRHGLTGIKGFSRASFERQLNVPGMVILRAEHAGETVGAHLWYVQGSLAYSHLMALTARGYELMASYALYPAALDYFGARVEMMDLGGGAGLHADADDGLTRFKRGWANGTRTSFLCGKIFDRGEYQQLVRARAVTADNYFPAYRANEFASVVGSGKGAGSDGLMPERS